MANPYQTVSRDSPPCSPTFDPAQHPQNDVEEIELYSSEVTSHENAGSDRIRGDRLSEAKPAASKDQPTELTKRASRESPQDFCSIEATADSRDAPESPPPKPSQNAFVTSEPSSTDVSKDQITETVGPVQETPKHTASTRQAHGIFWRSRLLMLTCFMLGLLASIGHHQFYRHFDGSIVGSTNEQEWNIRSVCFYLCIDQSD